MEDYINCVCIRKAGEPGPLGDIAVAGFVTRELEDEERLTHWLHRFLLRKLVCVAADLSSFCSSK